VANSIQLWFEITDGLKVFVREFSVVGRRDKQRIWDLRGIERCVLRNVRLLSSTYVISNLRNIPALGISANIYPIMMSKSVGKY
jgi:hypothetical protein